MILATDRVPRIVVGISRSSASWWALAWSVGEARQRGASLLLVHVFRPPLAPPVATVGQDGVSFVKDRYEDRLADGNALIRTAIERATGRMPDDVRWQEQVIPGRAGAELASLAWGSDLLVLGSRRRGPLRRLAPGSVARTCARRATCPVMLVPEPSSVALLAALPAGMIREPRFRWMPRRRERTAS